MENQFKSIDNLKEDTEKDEKNNKFGLLKIKKYNYFDFINNIKKDINNSLERIPNLKINKKKKSSKEIQKFFPGTIIVHKNTKNIYGTLMGVEKDSSPINIIKEEDKQNTTFSHNPKIKQKLLKEYNEAQKNEKKFRKIKIIDNLYDSLDDNEELTDEEDNDGLKLYIPSDSIFIFIFDLLIIFFSFYTLLVIPLDLAKAKFYCEKEEPLTMILKLCTEIIFILDILISFFRSHYDYEYKEITLTKKIISHYLTNGFIFDLIESFPSYTISRRICNQKHHHVINISNSEIFYSILLIIKNMKIFKSLNNKKNRVIEIVYLKVSQYYFLEKLINFLIYLIFFFTFFHLLICIHIFIGTQAYPNWIHLVHLENEYFAKKYIASFYFIIATMTTVGYGDIVCVSPIERVFQIILLAIGTVIYSFIITKFGNEVGKQSSIEMELSSKKNILEQIRMNYPLMPFKLYYKIHNYIVRQAHRKQNNKKNEVCMLVNSLPDKFKNNLLKVIYKDVINNFKIFKDCSNSDFIIKMLSFFVQATCKKDSILIEEGKKVENIVFVKDGHLILEATIDLSEPVKSIKKYFIENFKDIVFNDYRNSFISRSGAGDEENYENCMNKLKDKLKFLVESNNTKIMKTNMNFDINDINNESFQVGGDDKTFSTENGAMSNRGTENNVYLKILDIRKNEHFGDVYLFLDKPAPLTLKVKSKKAEIFFLKYKDAININKIHHNIIKRVKLKSYKNLLSIKRKTLKTIKNYYNINKFSNIQGKSLQDMSWFTEKSRNMSINDKTSFSSIPKSQKSKESNLSLFGRQNMFFKNSCLPSNIRREISKVKNTKIKKSITNSFINEKKNNKYKVSNFSHIKWSNKNNKKVKFKENTIIQSKLVLKKINSLNKGEELKRLKTQNENKIEISQSENNTIKVQNSNIYDVSFDKQEVEKSNNENENENFSKDNSNLETLKSNSKNIIKDFESSKNDEKKTIRNINSDIDKKIENKIKLRVMKENIIKLWKIQSQLFNSRLDNEKTISFLNYMDTETNFINNINELYNNINNNNNNIIMNDINSILYNKLLEYLEIENENVIEEEESSSDETQTRRFNELQFEAENIISFNIKSSYYNINKLTRGKIIKNDNCKKEIKNIINNYMENKNKRLLNKNLTSKNLTKLAHILLKPKSMKTNKNSLSIKDNEDHISSLEYISSILSQKENDTNQDISKIITENDSSKKQNKTNKISSKIKQTINNSTEIYINFKNMEINNQNSNIKINDNHILSEIPKINKKKAKKSLSNVNVILKGKKSKIATNFNLNKDERIFFSNCIPSKKGCKKKLSNCPLKLKRKKNEK